MLLSTLLDGICQYSGEDMEIPAITSDITKLNENDCFVYLTGVFRDKSYLLYQAVAKRPCVIIGEDLPDLPLPLIRVRDARATLSHMLYRFYFHKDSPPRLVGITGTNGKSSVCHMLKHLLKHRYRVGVMGTQMIEACGLSLTPDGYTMTTPDPELLYPMLFEMKRKGCEIVVMEVSSHALALGKVAPLTFEVAIFTGLLEDHLDFHRTKEEYKRAKEKIFLLSRFAVLNNDCPIGQEYHAHITIPSYTVGKNGSFFRILDVRAQNLFCSELVCEIDGVLHTIHLPIPAHHNAMNAAYALCAAIRLGIPKEDAIRALEKMPQIRGRLEYVQHNPHVVLDYAHTPSAIEAVLEYIYASKGAEAKIVVVFGAGGERDRSKRAKMSRAVEKYADFCVLTTDNMRYESQAQIFKDLKRGLRTQRHRFITDRTKAVAYAYRLCRAQDVLVLLGKGHENYILKKNKRIPYSELYALYLARKEIKTGED